METYFPESAPERRPYVILNMVESIDGRTTLDGSVGTLTGPADQDVVYGLREHADALLVGAGTVRNERYGSIVRGDARQPLVVIVSARLSLPADLPLLGEPETRILIATATSGELGFEHAASVDYLYLPDAHSRGVDLLALCETLRGEYGIAKVVCEGGPALNEGLIGARLVDELYVSVSPKIVGGGERTLLDGALPGGVIEARLLSVRAVEDYVFLRYGLTS
jgi:riboflavin-specific deaminase-like protein